MDLRHQLDVDVVAVENEDEVALMLELTAPATPHGKRAPATLQVVLDRSGSMDGDRLEHAKAALDALVVRLDPTDQFGLVAFDSDVHVIVAAGPLTDKTAVRHAIAGLHAGSMTNLDAADKTARGRALHGLDPRSSRSESARRRRCPDSRLRAPRRLSRLAKLRTVRTRRPAVLGRPLGDRHASRHP